MVKIVFPDETKGFCTDCWTACFLGSDKRSMGLSYMCNHGWNASKQERRSLQHKRLSTEFREHVQMPR